MSSAASSCNVYYFACPKCRRMALVPESFRYALVCSYCNCEMKEVVTLD